MGTEYQPGECNIGRGERRVRYGFGAVGFIVAAGLVVAVVLMSWPSWWLLVTVVPLFAGFVGYYQGREAFCVRFAVEGVYNVGDDLDRREAVTDAAAARQDRRQARRLLVRSATAAIAVAIGVFVVGSALAG